MSFKYKNSRQRISTTRAEKTDTGDKLELEILHFRFWQKLISIRAYELQISYK